MLTFVAAVTLALLGSFLCSIMESVLLSLGTTDVEAMVKDGKRSGRLMKHFKNRIDIPIAAILIVNTIAHTVGAAVAGASYESAFNRETLWIFTIVFTAAVLLLTEIIPKTLGVTHARSLAGPVAYSIQTLNFLLRPVIWVTERISRLLRREEPDPVTSVEEIQLLASLGRREGVLGPRTAGIIVGATRLSQLRAIDVMVSRQNVRFLSGTRSREQNLGMIRDSRHSRLPYSPNDELDQVAGIVLVKNLLLDLEKNPGGEIDWEALMDEPMIVPESMPLNTMLRAFQENRRHMAIVVDEYGDVEGIVTLEDVLEEIVGEIVDESDRDVQEIWPGDDGSLEILATIDMRKVGEQVGHEWFADGETLTAGGLLSEQLGRIPTVGDTVDWNGYRFEVLSASRRRAERILVTKLAVGRGAGPATHD